jgi:hypothetical protein
LTSIKYRIIKVLTNDFIFAIGTKKPSKLPGMEDSAIFEEEILVEDDRTPSDMQRIQEILDRLNLT